MKKQALLRFSLLHINELQTKKTPFLALSSCQNLFPLVYPISTASSLRKLLIQGSVITAPLLSKQLKDSLNAL